MMTNPPTLALDVTTPGDWHVFSPAQIAERPAVDVLVAARVAEEPALGVQRNALADLIARTMARADEEGVVLTGVMAGTDEVGRPLMANLALATAAVSPQEAAAADAVAASDGDLAHADPLFDLQALGVALAASVGVDVSQQVIESVVLAAGAALRTARLEDVSLASGAPTVTLLTVQYFVPIQAAHNRVAILSFTTPSVGAHLHLQGIFDQIAQSLTIR